LKTLFPNFIYLKSQAIARKLTPKVVRIDIFFFGKDGFLLLYVLILELFFRINMLFFINMKIL